MGGGRNGCFGGTPMLHLFVEKFCVFWEVLNGVGVDGVGGIFPFFCFFSFFFAFLRFSSSFFAFLRFSSFFSYSFRTRANDCNLLGKWGISLRPRLHRPRSELPEFSRVLTKNRGAPKTAVPTTTHPIPHLTPFPEEVGVRDRSFVCFLGCFHRSGWQK